MQILSASNCDYLTTKPRATVPRLSPPSLEGSVGGSLVLFGPELAKIIFEIIIMNLSPLTLTFFLF